MEMLQFTQLSLGQADFFCLSSSAPQTPSGKEGTPLANGDRNVNRPSPSTPSTPPQGSYDVHHAPYSDGIHRTPIQDPGMVQLCSRLQEQNKYLTESLHAVQEKWNAETRKTAQLEVELKRNEILFNKEERELRDKIAELEAEIRSLKSSKTDTKRNQNGGAWPFRKNGPSQKKVSHLPWLL
jgi:hypothetical protein